MRAFTLLLFVLTCWTVQAQSFRQDFTEANILYEDGVYALAIRIYSRMLKTEPDNANIHYKIGRAHLDMGVDKTKALDHLKIASKGINKSYDPFNPRETGAPADVLYYLAHTYHLMYEFDSANVYYDKFIEKSGKKHYLKPTASRGKEMVVNAKELMSDSLNVRIVNIGEPINTKYAEYAPIIGFDENSMYFTSRRRRSDQSNLGDIDVTTGLHFEDIYVSFRDLKGNWQEPELVQITDTLHHSSVVSMSTNGATLYIYKSEEDNGNIYMSNFLIGDGWAEPSLVGSDVNSENNEYYANIAYHERILYFTSDREGGFGGRDIYYVRRLPNGEWGKAQNLGEPINSEYDEDLPYFHPDDRTMYFASNGHKSMGGYDIFYSQLGDDSIWSEPINIGYPINTTDDDHSYIASPDGDRGYYASKSHGSMGVTDLFMIEYMEEEDERPELDLSAFAVLKGWVITEDGHIPDGFKVVMREGETGNFIGEAKPVIRNGSFVFIIPSDASYHVDYMLDAKTLFDETIEIEAGTKYQELKREIFLFKKQGEYHIIAIDDDVLGQVVKWKIAMNNTDILMPVNSKVYYLDEEGTKLDSSFVSKDGYFEYKPTALGQHVILKPAIEGYDASQMKIDLIDIEDNVAKIELINKEELFIQEVAPILTVEDRQLEMEAPEVTGAEEPNMEASEETGIEEPNMEMDEGLTFKITMDYNATESDDFNKSKNQILARVREEIQTNDRCNLSLTSSASTVPTSLEGGNYELSKRRLEAGKKMLLELLEESGIDMNKISTISEESIISGPDYFTDPSTPKSVFVEYQYFMIEFN